MPTDAKCGLLVGVGVVLTVAVLFFQKDSPGQSPTPPAAVVKPPAPPPPPATTTLPSRPAPAGHGG
jgi:hypothetical protein